MKRFLTILFAAVCLLGTATADSDVYSYNELVQGYTGEVTLSYWPSSSSPLYSAADVYSHMGLITSESTNAEDIKYWTANHNMGENTEPKWTKNYYGTSWQLTFTDIYTYFGAPGTADITGIAVIMHDGQGSSATYEMNKYGDYFIIPIKKPTSCTYTVLMKDAAGDGWDGGALHIWDAGYRTNVTMYSGSSQPYVLEAHGGTPTCTWTSGSWDYEVGFDFIAAGGKVIYSQESGSSVATPFTPSDPCSAEEGDYTLKNLKATSAGINQLEFAWDANSKFSHYVVRIYDPDGVFFVSDYTDENKILFNLGEATKSGKYKVQVYGMDDSYSEFGGGVSLEFDFEPKALGSSTIRLLIPSDSELDVTKDVMFAWYGDDEVRHPAKMTQESGSRWWSVTTDIALSKFYYEFYIQTEEKKRQELSSGGYVMVNALCKEAGGFYYESTDGDGVVHRRYSLYDAACDAKDHNYNIASTTTKVEDGKFIITIVPAKDQADYYSINLYSGEHVDVAYGSFDDGKLTWEWMNTTADVKLTSWEINAHVWDDEHMMIFDVGTMYVEKKEVEVPNPYIIKNLTVTKAEENRYTLSWDAFDNAKSFNINVTAPSPSYILEGRHEVGKDIKKVGDKFQITTDPVISAGTCSYYIDVYDEKDNDRAYIYGDFDVASVDDIGDAAFNVLIPEDACYDVSNGVWFCWSFASEPDKWVQATKASDSHWYSANLGTVNASSFKITVGNNTEANWSLADKIELNPATGKNSKYELYWDYENSVWALAKANEDTKDHNYIPQDVEIVPNTTTGELAIKLTVVDKLAEYWVGLVKKGESSVSYTYNLRPEESETTTLNFVVNPRATEEVEIEKVQVHALNEYGDMYTSCTKLEKSVSFKIPRNPAFPTGLNVEKNEDNSLTFSWNGNDGVQYYSVEVRYEGEYQMGMYVYPEFTPAKDGKHSILYKDILGDGKYKFTVTAYDLEYYYCGSPEIEYTMSGSKALGDVKMRLLVPSDNNMDISAGLWLCYWFVGEDRVTNGRFVEMTEKEAGSHWYEGTFNEATQSSFRYVYVNANTWTGSPSFTYPTGLNTDTEICDELMFKPDYAYIWETQRVACDAKDHNYIIDKVEIDNSKPGQATFTITPKKDIAPSYSISYCKHGTGSYEFLCEWENSNTVTVLFTNSKDEKYDFQIYAHNVIGYYGADPFECTEDIKANGNVPTDLKATVAKDGVTTTFEWKKVGEDVAWFGIEVRDYYYDSIQLDVKKITGEQYVAQFILPSYHGWKLAAYNSAGEVLAVVDGPSFEITGADLRPYYLNVAVNGKKATFAWEAPMAVPACYYEIWDDYDIVASDVVTGKNGQYTATFQLDKDTLSAFSWTVRAVAADKTPISVRAYGDNFYIQGSTSDVKPAVEYTLNISAEVGGIVNNAVNGKWAKDAKVTLRATPFSSWEFDQWSDGDKNAVRKITMDKDYDLTAKFKTTATFKLEISAGEHGSVNTEVNNTYKGGEKVTIKATPDKGYAFGAWSDGNTQATREIIIVEDLELTAYFVVQKKFTLSVILEPGDEAGKVLFDDVEESGNSVTVTEGKIVTLKAVPASGYKFVRFEDNGAKITEKEYDVKVTKNINITAVFEKNSEAIENVSASGASAEKIFHEGHIYILRDGNIYTITGSKVK